MFSIILSKKLKFSSLILIRFLIFTINQIIFVYVAIYIVFLFYSQPLVEVDIFIFVKFCLKLCSFLNGKW